MPRHLGYSFSSRPPARSWGHLVWWVPGWIKSPHGAISVVHAAPWLRWGGSGQMFLGSPCRVQGWSGNPWKASEHGGSWGCPWGASAVGGGLQVPLRSSVPEAKPGVTERPRLCCEWHYGAEGAPKSGSRTCPTTPAREQGSQGSSSPQWQRPGSDTAQW